MSFFFFFLIKEMNVQHLTDKIVKVNHNIFRTWKIFLGDCKLKKVLAIYSTLNKVFYV